MKGGYPLWVTSADVARIREMQKKIEYAMARGVLPASIANSFLGRKVTQPAVIGAAIAALEREYDAAFAPADGDV